MVAPRRQANLVMPFALLAVLIVLGGVALGLALSLAPAGGYTSLNSAAPAAGVTRGSITINDAAERITITSGDLGDQLYRARIDHAGSAPGFSYADGNIRIERASNIVNFWNRARDVIDITVSPTVAWSIRIDAAGTLTRIDLANGRLRALKVDGAGGDVAVTAARPQGLATVSIDGVGTGLSLAVPAGTEYRVTANGVGTRIDGETTSAGWTSAADRYDVALNGVGVHASVTATRIP